MIFQQPGPNSQITAQQRFLDKRNFAYWVGRIYFNRAGQRDRQRHELHECASRFREAGDRRANLLTIKNGGNADMMVSIIDESTPETLYPEALRPYSNRIM